MLKIFVIGLLYLTVSGELIPAHLETEYLLSGLQSSGHFMQGFFEGLLKDPSTASSNPCLIKMQETDAYRENMFQAIRSINGPESFVNFFPVMRKYADSYNQEISVCNYPTLLTLTITALRLDNMGEYFVRYLVRKEFYDGLWKEAEIYCQAGEYQICGKDVGQIFSGLTLFSI